jgi:DNA-binding LacI/PurR family transcriptional regulator
MANRNKTHPPTITDVARMAGVSVSTVSRVLNGTAVVVPETAERVQAVIAELNFVPRPAARGLVSRRTNAIGLLLPEIGGTFFSPLLRGIERGVSDAGFDLLIQSTQVLAHTATHHSRLGEHNTDGVLVFVGAVSNDELERLHGRGFPMVLVYQSSPAGLDIPGITVENRQGAFDVVEHLITVHGRRRIAFLRGPAENEDSAIREGGYREALEKHGIPFDPRLVGTGNYEAEAACEATRSLLRDGVDFDAIFSGDDDSAGGVYAALREAGRRIPDDVAVVGFDDAPFAGLFSPPLTTVGAQVEQVGLEAVRQLVHLVREGHTDPLVVLPTQVLIRQSCGCGG